MTDKQIRDIASVIWELSSISEDASEPIAILASLIRDEMDAREMRVTPNPLQGRANIKQEPPAT
jgi:hypothetical protein